MVQVREVPLHRTHELGLFRELEHLGPEVEALRREAEALRPLLGVRRVWMLNSTALGGGVAEMLPRKCNLLSELGIDARWLVLEPDSPTFFRVTKALHNALHGAAPSAPLAQAQARADYDAVCAAAASRLRMVDPSDVLVVHDPQPAGVALHLPRALRPRLVWRCHLGVAEGSPWAAQAWDFLLPYLAPYERVVFSAAGYVPEPLRPRAAIISPGIDPLSHKNRELRVYKLVGVLAAAGLAEGRVAAWARFAAPARRFLDGRWEAAPIPDLLHAPLVLQVSRFDRLKGFQFLMPAFAHLERTYADRSPHLRAPLDRVAQELAAAQLVLAGPDPSGVADDPEAQEVLDALCAQHARLPRPLAERVHLVRLPMEDAKCNALTVNALQRLAQVVVQLSVQEGFGLTATEALWKATPVIASNVGGLRLQVRHGIDGLLVQDPEDAREVSAALLEVLAHPMEAEARARQGRARVREHFVVLRQVRRWLEELRALLAGG